MSNKRMVHASFRPTKPLMVLAFKDNHDSAVPIPAGKVIDVLGPAADDRFMIVSVDGEQFHVFESDLLCESGFCR